MKTMSIFLMSLRLQKKSRKLKIFNFLSAAIQNASSIALLTTKLKSFFLV